ncbi:twin-arginine translocase TatA/TatE family subunit [Spelaeicoccus albus]|uniref:Sec-independent protein translocase protein TatB n=1 Tax=Spelaeicoccus albus TaxID=1280376 RepID=A0A7Z0D3D2_9MICO|nr:twin-arginine translocase TatA/TatE family subunit [Spelaeicoccus albus]NYI68086.1 sec-independent protein translocase protein TatB [Spelaeicoccus albus]
MFNITGGEMVILIVVAIVVLGPNKLPQYAKQLRELVRNVKKMADNATQQVKDELGDEFTDVDWAKLDPRQYDPRRIVRDALNEDDEDDEDSATGSFDDDDEDDGDRDDESPGSRVSAQAALRVPGEPAPFDSEAT